MCWHCSLYNEVVVLIHNVSLSCLYSPSAYSSIRTRSYSASAADIRQSVSQSANEWVVIQSLVHSIIQYTDNLRVNCTLRSLIAAMIVIALRYTYCCCTLLLPWRCVILVQCAILVYSFRIDWFTSVSARWRLYGRSVIDSGPSTNGHRFTVLSLPWWSPIQVLVWPDVT